ncbi:MAG: Rieske 2Fe-2S domain-containing protein [Candidatus Bathyarchaeia archaeon]|jgi:nitrite reductase/ring-hydroxylating ferredoxin subunit
MTIENTQKQVEFAVTTVASRKHATFVKVAKTTDIPVGKMKHLEVDGLSVLIANVKGKFYVVYDRCPHLSAMLSKGTLNDSIITCPRHFSSFDVTTGRSISGTRNSLQTYELKVDGNDLLIES